MRFLNAPSFRVHDSPVSLSKSAAFHESEIDALVRIAELDMPGDVRRGLYRKIGLSHHDLSDFYRRKQDYTQSRRHHLKSLIRPGGYRHLAYSRKLLPWWPQ